MVQKGYQSPIILRKILRWTRFHTFDFAPSTLAKTDFAGQTLPDLAFVKNVVPSPCQFLAYAQFMKYAITVMPDIHIYKLQKL